MKALTICVPYPSFILDAELPQGIERKKTENRSWEMLYRGPLLIHAGLSKKWMATVRFEQRPKNPVYGAIIGVVDVIDCVHILELTGPRETWSHKVRNKYPWLPTHQHASGPYCIILENPRKFISPIPYKGAQGLFNVPDSVVAEQMRKVA